MTIRHFLTQLDLTPAELSSVIDRAIELKRILRDGEVYEPLKNRVMAMIFEKSSTRTRVSFEAGMAQFGGHAMFLSSRDTQLGRGEPISDSARVISSMVDVVMIRTHGHEIVEEFAANSSVPVINALTNEYHPCQLLADMQTYREHRGSIQGKIVTWVGDGNNVLHSLMLGCPHVGMNVRVATPDGYEPFPDVVSTAEDVADVRHASHPRAITGGGRCCCCGCCRCAQELHAAAASQLLSARNEDKFGGQDGARYPQQRWTFTRNFRQTCENEI
mgnify:CR=1 FL=1